MSGQSLYESDFYTWTQQQAELLQQVRDNRLDAHNLAEEVADLGRGQLGAVESHLRQLFRHLIKLAASPADRPVGHWLGEVREHRSRARTLFSPGMRQHLDLRDIWEQGIAQANDDLAGFDEPVVPTDLPCPFTLDDVLDRNFDPKRGVQVVAQTLARHAG